MNSGVFAYQSHWIFLTGGQIYRKARSLFESVEEQLEYMKNNILLDGYYAAALAQLGRHQEAAEIHMAEGRTLEAIKVLLDDEENNESKRRASDCILQGLWESTSFSRKIKDTDALLLNSCTSRPR